MACSKEVEYLILKFNQLWRDGFEAELQFKCNAGKAFANLQLGLGFADGIEPTMFSNVTPLKKQVSPSRQRRRIRRENERKLLIPSPGNDATCEDNVSAEKDVDGDLNDELVTVISNTHSTEIEDDEVKEVAVQDNINANDYIDDENTKSTAETVVAEASETQTGSVKDSQEILQLNESKREDNTIGTVKNLPCATVHATAVFKNCPNAQLTQDDIESLGRFITCTDHLKKNVATVHHDLVFSDGVDMNGTFQHSVQVRIVVRTENLWQGARSYLWKHLGNDEWERSNGTTITLIRIHQK